MTAPTHTAHSNSNTGAWECPRCHQINAPWRSACDCKADTVGGNADSGTWPAVRVPTVWVDPRPSTTDVAEYDDSVQITWTGVRR